MSTVALPHNTLLPSLTVMLIRAVTYVTPPKVNPQVYKPVSSTVTGDIIKLVFAGLGKAHENRWGTSPSRQLIPGISMSSRLHAMT